MRHHHPVVEAVEASEEPTAAEPEKPVEPVEPVEPLEPVAPVAAPAPKPTPPRHKPHPSPHDLAELSGAFAMTANVADPEPEVEPVYVPAAPALGQHDHEEIVTERGLRGLVGGGASQVSVAAALRARDAARPSDADVAAAEEELVIVRRGWVPREELPRPGRR
jgi:hypothetical protein